MLVDQESHSEVAKKNTSHGSEVLPQDTTHLIQDRVTNEEVRAKDFAAGRRTTGKPSDHRKDTKIEMVLTYLSFIRSDQNHLARHSEKKTRQREEEVGRQHHGMDRPGVRQVSESRGERRKENTGGNWMLSGQLWCPNNPGG